MEILTKTLQKVTKEAYQGSDGARRALAREVRALAAKLETPLERIFRLSYLDMYKLSSIRIAVNVGLFKVMAPQGLDRRVYSTSELAAQTNVDKRLLERILRALALDDLIDEHDAGQWVSNECTEAWANSSFTAVFEDTFDCHLPAIQAFPQFVKERNYSEPREAEATAFKMGHATNLHMFEWLAEPGNEVYQDAFNRHMTAKNLMTKRWFEVVDLNQVLGRVQSQDAPLLVDIGGNVGHDLIALNRAHPELEGKLILMDLPGPISHGKSLLPPSVGAVEYDFFTPQPILGAKNYFFHMVLHDWPDNKCQEILRAQIPALKRGYSKILINDIVIPEKGAGWIEVGIDLAVMNVHSATERTEREWRSLIESVGLKVAKIWDCAGQPEKLIEVEL